MLLRMHPLHPVICIFGPSGSGKDTVVSELLRRHPARFHKFISTTTRAPRPGEIDGQDYHFVNDYDYDRMNANEDFLFHASFAGTRYGTLKREVFGFDQTLIMIVVEDIAMRMQALVGAACIEITVPAPVALHRMIVRGDHPARAQERLVLDAQRAAQYISMPRITIINDQLEIAVQQLENAIHIVERQHGDSLH